MEGRFPDFIIAGVPKAGTTSLYYYLRQHPQIFLPAHPYKEPQFFIYAERPETISEREKDKRIWRLKDYLELFKDARPGQAAGEVSAAYTTFYKNSVENIKKYVPHYRDIKIIIILRNPAERVYSHYHMNIIAGYETEDFTKFVMDKSEPQENKRYIKGTFYYPQVKLFLDNFDRVKIYLFDDLKKDPAGLVKDMFRFLGVEDSFVPDMAMKYNIGMIPKSKAFQHFLMQPNTFKKFLKLVLPKKVTEWVWYRAYGLNRGKAKPRMDEETKNALKEVFREDIIKLQGLIGRDLSAWL